LSFTSFEPEPIQNKMPKIEPLPLWPSRVFCPTCILYDSYHPRHSFSFVNGHCTLFFFQGKQKSHWNCSLCKCKYSSGSWWVRLLIVGLLIAASNQ